MRVQALERPTFSDISDMTVPDKWGFARAEFAQLADATVAAAGSGASVPNGSGAAGNYETVAQAAGAKATPVDITPGGGGQSLNEDGYLRIAGGQPSA